jgi:hypothetical protein
MNQNENGSDIERTAGVGRPLVPAPEAQTIPPDEYAAAFGEDLARTLDLGTWQRGEDLARLYDRLEGEIQEAVRLEDKMRVRIREVVFPQLFNRAGAPRNAGVYQTNAQQVELVHRGYLFNGQVEACDGNSIPFDTLPLAIVQIGVCTVSYQGDQGTWVHRLYRRDLRMRGGDPVEEALDLLEHRRRRTGYDQESRRDTLTSLGRRGIMAYAERAVLLKRCEAPWRMGQGNPAPYELITGSGMVELLERSLDILEELVLDHKKFVFVPSAPSDRVMLTIGNALRPLEYAIVDTLEVSLTRIVNAGHYRGSWGRVKARLDKFVKEAGPQIIVGMYRATPMASAHMFYAHVDHADVAAHIAMADSALQEHRGFPMLLSLADTVCSTVFSTESLVAPAMLAYTDAGAPYRYLTERQTRR